MKRVRAVGLALIVLFGGGAIFVAFVWLKVQEEAPYDAVEAQFHSVEMKISAFALDLHRLPATLDELVESADAQWRGPYARSEDFAIVPLRYEVLDQQRREFRLSLADSRLEQRRVAQHKPTMYLGSAALGAQ
ncbi:MAG TPA: type II secretion system protein GspG [Rudaea sp.]|nr:type II secretion system protein GspG [Rudaea sp.]